LAAYRIVFHDEDGQPVAESAFEHPDDQAAIDHAERHPHPHEMHIWQAGRLVARLPPWPRIPGERR